MNDINIKETIEDKNSFFNVKRFSLKGLKPDFPIKTIDITNTNKKTIEKYSKIGKGYNLIYEKSKFLKFEDITNIINQKDNKKIDSFFGRKAWLDDRFHIIHLTLKFNPYKYLKKIEDIEGFWHYYYTYSGNVLFIPNILESMTPYDEMGKVQKKIQIINIDDYIKFVDEIYDFLQKKNNKHFFVPISLKFTIAEIKNLIEHYIKKEYFYYWIDFEAKSINQALSARIRQINTFLRESGYFEKCLITATNIKREIISNLKKDKTPASDILGTICGANLVGVNREPIRAIQGNKNARILFEHKSRTFDDKSYYYFKLKQKLSKQENITDNAIRLSNEFKNQKDYFLENFEIENYLRKKEMIKNHNKGEILKSFFNIKDKQRTLI